MFLTKRTRQLHQVIVAVAFISAFSGPGRASASDGQTPDQPKGIYIYDLTTGTQEAVATGAEFYGAAHIAGQHVIWTEGPSSQDELRLYSLAENTTQSIAPGHRVITADIDGQRIVWYEISNDLSSHIYLYDISERRTSKIARVPLVYSGPIVRGDFVVWADYNRGEGDIFLYDIRSGQQQQITRREPSDVTIYRGATKYLGFDGSRITWTSTTWNEPAPAQSSLHVYDVTSGAETSIPLERFTYSDVAIAGDQVVWGGGGYSTPLYLTQVSAGTHRVLLDQMKVQSVEFDGDRVVCEVMFKGGQGYGHNKDVFLIDVGTGNVTRLSNTPGIERRPDMDGQYIVWMIQ